MKWKKYLFPFTVLLIVCAVGWHIRQTFVHSLRLQTETLTYMIKGYDSWKRGNLDSAIYYHRLATLVEENTKTEDARFTLARAFYDKVKQLRMEYGWMVEQRKTDREPTYLEFTALIDSAQAVYNTLKQKHANPKRLYVLEKLVVDDDESLWYDEKEDTVYHFTH